MNGWIKLHRRLLDHKLWTAPRRFSMAEAWIDLLLRAAHAEQTIVRDYGSMVIKRGQILTSQVALAKRWGWHRESVSKFLRFLNTDSMADTQTSKATESGYTLITLCNYEQYQGPGNSEEQADTSIRTDNRADIRPTSDRHPNGTYKKEKKEKKSTPANGLPPGFAVWWDEYPKKVGKIQAVREWEKLDPDEALQAKMLEALRGQKRTVKAMAEHDQQHTLDPERWIKYGRWEDEVAVPSNGGSQYPAL